MENMPEVCDWPADGRMTHNGIHYKIKNRTSDAFPFVIRHQPGLSRTALMIQLSLAKHLDKADSVAVPGRIAPKRYHL